MKSLFKIYPLVVLVSCVDSTQPDDTLIARDTEGHEVRIDVGDDALQISSLDRQVTVAWSESEATLGHAGVTDVFVRADEHGWALQPENPAFAGLGPMIGAAEQRVELEGIALPWRGLSSTVANACNTTSTWVWSGDNPCFDCYFAANEQGGLGSSWQETSKSCSVGSLYTTCSVTKCRNVEEFEMPLAN